MHHLRYPYQKKTFLLLLIALFVSAIGILLITLCFYVFENQGFNLYLSHLLVVLTFIFSFFIWNKTFGLGRRDPINYLLASLFIFMGSESITYLLGLNGLGSWENHPVHLTDYIKANFIIIVGVLFLLVGSAIGFFNKKSLSVSLNKKTDVVEVATPSVGLLLLGIGILAFVLDFDLEWINLSYRNFGTTTMWRLVWKTALPVAGFVLMPSNNKKYKSIGIITLIGLFVIYVLIGNRGYAFSLILTTFWLYNFKIKKVNIVKTLIFCFAVIFLISLFFQMKSLSVSEKLDFDTYTSVEINPFESLLLEGSASYKSVLYTVQNIPEIKDFDYGASYLWAFSTLVPNVFGTEIHPAKLRYSPSDWLRWTFNPEAAERGQGYGFSIIAEGYYNFGVFGVVIVMMLLGFVIFNATTSINRSNMVYPTVLLAIFLHNLLWGVRNITESIVRPVGWEILFLVMAYTIVKLLSKTHMTRIKN